MRGGKVDLEDSYPRVGFVDAKRAAVGVEARILYYTTLMYNVVRKRKELEGLGANAQPNIPYVPWEVLSLVMHSFNIKESVSNMIDVKPSCQAWKRPYLIANTSHWRADRFKSPVLQLY